LPVVKLLFGRHTLAAIKSQFIVATLREPGVGHRRGKSNLTACPRLTRTVL